MKELTEINFQHYVAGFLDGDGSINAQIVQRKDYILKFQIRFTITFFQKTSRHWFMIWLDKRLKIGTIRKRNDGISEYTITGAQNVKKILLWLLPALQIKKPQAKLILSIIEKQFKNQTKEDFVASCEMVDKIVQMNDSKLRINLSSVVKKILLEDFSLDSFPVETSEE
jgi:hypothetical protein